LSNQVKQPTVQESIPDQIPVEQARSRQHRKNHLSRQSLSAVAAAIAVLAALPEIAHSQTQRSTQTSPAQTELTETKPAQIEAVGPQQHQAAGVSFTAPVGFSALQPLGGETVGVLFPAAAAQARHVSVRLADLSPGQMGVAALPPADLAEYARFNFFGITSPPQHSQTRSFLGQVVTGTVLVQPNQNGGTSYIEFYLVPLSNQRQLAIAFETDTELPIMLFEQTVQTVTESMRELPSKKKRY
jgi:hypothetical protein